MSCVKSLNGGKDGTCGDVILGQDPGGACATLQQGQCDGKGACACNNLDTTCGGTGCPKCGPGKQCNGDGDCASNFCRQGVCCNTDCTGACNSCNVGPTWAGTCTKEFIGAAGGCAANQACNNNQTTQTCVAGGPNGAACNGNGQCVSGKCANSVCVVPNQNMGFPCRDNNDCDNGGCQANHFCG